MVFLKLKGILEIFRVSVQRWSIYIISDTETTNGKDVITQRSDYKDFSEVT